MTDREKEILQLIKATPMISQKEIADTLGITRSSVAVHISNLQRKGYIAGKGYIIKEGQYICVIGGAAIDIQGFSNKELILRDSNPGRVKVSLGGVGRNVAENLVRMGLEVKLLCVVGDDSNGKKILEDGERNGLIMSDALILRGKSTATYLTIMDNSGDLLGAIADMDIYNHLNLEYIREKRHIIQHGRLCMLDTNLPLDVIDYILNIHSEKEFFLDTVSTTKAFKVKELIGKFHTIKPNLIETEALTGMTIKDDMSLKRAGEFFLKKGVKKVFITLGSKGAFYTDGYTEGRITGREIEVINATGAGDAFTAGLIFSHLKGFNLSKSAAFSIAAAQLALSHESAINPNMSYDNILKEMEVIDDVK